MFFRKGKFAVIEKTTEQSKTFNPFQHDDIAAYKAWALENGYTTTQRVINDSQQGYIVKIEAEKIEQQYVDLNKNPYI